MRPLIISVLLLSFTLTASAGDGEKVEVKTLPDAVKATVAKEAGDATEAMKITKDGKTVYKVKAKGADGHPLMLIIGEDGAVISKHGPKDKDKGDKKEK